MSPSALRGRLARQLRPLELALVVLVMLTLLIVAIRSMTPVFALAERESMRAGLYEMRRGLMLAAVVALARGDQQTLAELEHANPVELSPVRPARYAGEYADDDVLRVYRSHWYFDPRGHVLGYRVAADEAFEGGADAPPRARFRVGLRYVDSDADGRFTPGVDTFTGIDLEALEAWRWR